MTINLDSDIFNPVYLPSLNSTSRYQIYYGGAGSGKSVFCSQKLVFNMLSYKTCNVLVVRKVARTNRFTTFELITRTIRLWSLSLFFVISLSSMTIKCTLNKNKFIFMGLDDVLKIKSITGISMIWIELASLITQDDLKQLNLRLRGQYHCPFQILLSFNPISQNHWLKSYFFDNPKDNSSILKTTYIDNKYLDALYKQQLESLKDLDLNYYNIYCLGNWGLLGQLIYTNCVIELLDIQLIIGQSQYVSVGQDWGYNDPSVSLLVAVQDSDIYVLDLLYVNKVTKADLMALIRRKGLDQYKIYADSALPATIADFKNNGFMILGVKKFPGSVLAKINQIKSKKIHVNSICSHTIKLIQSYSWKHDLKTNTYLDLPIGFNDHCMDALRYAVNFDFVNSNKGYIKGWCR